MYYSTQECETFLKMTSNNLKVESGLQLLARLSKKVTLANFYPILFRSGPQIGHIIELYSDQSTHQLLEDIISETLVPKEFGGVEASVLVLNTDGILPIDILRKSLKIKIHTRVQNNMPNFNINLENLINSTLKNLFVIEIFDATQFYTTLHNLENILSKHSNISLVVINSLTAFYWSEQGFKLIKMDLYKKKLISLIQKVTKDHKVTVLYNRPEYFSSTKESINNLEPCCENATEEHLNYRIHVVYCNNNNHYVDVQAHDKIQRIKFQVTNNVLEWVV